MKASHSHVKNALDAPTKALESNRSLLRNGQVRSPSANNTDTPGSRSDQVWTHSDAARPLVKNGLRQSAFDSLEV
jgi:hypothetical protein